MPLELIDDLSNSASWLSYARSTTAMSAKATVSALRGESKPVKPRSVYEGKTYNSSEAIAEFFQKKKLGSAAPEKSAEKPKTGFDKLRAIATPPSQKQDTGMLAAGAYVRHEKYGRGLVLRREGSGDNVKLTVSFPGYGQKKLIERYANLQKD